MALAQLTHVAEAAAYRRVWAANALGILER